MAILNIPSITKGQSASITLNKSELFQLAAIAADVVFSVQANVKKCIVEYNSDPGNQRKILRFDLSQATPSASLLISATGKDSFLLERMVLEDNDGGLLILERSDLPSGLDISIGSNGGSGNGLPVSNGLYSWFKAESLSLSTGDSVTSWSDESNSIGSANMIQDGSSSTPIYVVNSINSLPAIRNTASSYLKMLRRLPDSNTVFVVAKCTDNGVRGAIYSEQPAVGSGTSPLAIYNEGGTLKGYHSFAGNSVQAPSIGSISTDAFVHAVATVGGVSFNHYLNGILSATVTGNAMAIGSDIYSSHDKTFLFNFFTWYFRGDIAEFIVYDRVLTNEERNSVTQHLANKYAITVS